MNKDSIIKKTGKGKGKILAIICGIHGNEKAGILAVKKVLKDIEIKCGTVYFVFANPLAIKKGKRLVNKNLNRLFSKDNKGSTYEDKRARELMKLLNECDALLDIHSYNSKTGEQFAISEKRGFKILKNMDFPIVASGFSKLGNGTDGYMEKNKKIGICVECGTSNRYKKFIPLAEKTIYQFLQYFKSIDKVRKYSSIPQKFLKVDRMIIKKNKNFRFVKNFKDFEKLEYNKPFAYDGEAILKAGKNECIIFPRPKAEVGGEAGIIGKFLV